LLSIHAPKGHLFCQTITADNVRRKVVLYTQGAIFCLAFTRQKGIFFVKPLQRTTSAGKLRSVHRARFLFVFMPEKAFWQIFKKI
jgi:hypothetical protein